MTARQRSVAWVLLGAVALALVAFAAVDRDDRPMTNAERAYALADQFACPVCQGQSVAESDVPIAREIRREIRSRLDQGQTDAQIRTYLVSLYGDDIDLVPPATGVRGLVWVIPVVGFVAAASGLAAVFHRWRREEQRQASDEDRDLVARLLAGRADPGAAPGDGDGDLDGRGAPRHPPEGSR